jgi:hypothetical protein
MWKEVVMGKFEVLSQNLSMAYLSQDSHCLDWDLNTKLSEYKPDMWHVIEMHC